MPGGWRGIAVLVLILLAAAALIGLWPLQVWLPDTTGNAEGSGAALLGGTAPVLGLYLVTRVLLDLGGTLAPGWWGWPLIVLGARR